MTMKKIFMSTAITTMLLSITACGHRVQPVYNVNRHVMPLEAENLSDKQRGERIRLAASKRGWSCREVAAQKLICRVTARSHRASVDVDHNKHYFSINYLDSSNLRHKKGRIHPKYNKWIKRLEQAIVKTVGLVQLGQSDAVSRKGTPADTPVANTTRYHHTKKTILEETRSSNAGRDGHNDRGQYEDRNDVTQKTANTERANQERIAQEHFSQERLAEAQAHREQLSREAKVTNDRLAHEQAERDRLAREVAAHNKAEREQLARERANLERRRAESIERSKSRDTAASSVKEVPIGNVDHVELEW